MSVRVRLPNLLAVLDDRALLNRFVEEQDQPAFEQLVKRHGGLVLGVCRRAVRDAHLAEDAFQAAFLVLARNPKRAAEATSVGAWLFGIARRVGLAARRHEKRRAKHEQNAKPACEGDGESQPEFDDLLRVLDEELAALPEDLRAALVACFLQERTQDDAARELGWSLSTLRRKLERGKELLRARLTRRGVTLAAGLLGSALASPVRGAVLSPTPSALSILLAAQAMKTGISAKLLAAVAASVLAVGGIAFGLTHEPDPAPEPAPAPVTRDAELKQWVTVSGRVVFPKDGEIPLPGLVGRVRNADVWEPGLAFDDLIVHAENRGIANALVFLRADSHDRNAAFPADKIHPHIVKAKPKDWTVFVDRRGHFMPRVLAVRAGDRIVIENRLPVMTDVRYDAWSLDRSNEARKFHITLPSDATHTTKPLPGSYSIEGLGSSVHPWMRCYMWSFDHPYFAITDKNGKFEIANAPAGNWRLVVWHETAGAFSARSAPRSGHWGEKLTIPGNRSGKLELAPLVLPMPPIVRQSE